MPMEHEPSECLLELAVDSIPRTLKAGQMVDLIRAYAPQKILALLKLRVFWPRGHDIVKQLHDVGILVVHG